MLNRQYLVTLCRTIQQCACDHYTQPADVESLHFGLVFNGQPRSTIIGDQPIQIFLLIFFIIYLFIFINMKPLSAKVFDASMSIDLLMISITLFPVFLLNTACTPEQFRCDNGVCLSENRWCNGFRDCPDGTDEPVNCEVCEFLFHTTSHRYQ